MRACVVFNDIMFVGLRRKNTMPESVSRCTGQRELQGCGRSPRLVAAVTVHVYRRTPTIQQKATPIISHAQDSEALILPPVICASLELNTPAFKHYRVGQ